MISQKFSSLSDDRIAGFVGNDGGPCDDDVLDHVSSMSDLWVLANIKKTFNEESGIHSRPDDNDPDVFPPHGGEDTPGCCDRPG